jgi:hypothetical protein
VNDRDWSLIIQHTKLFFSKVSRRRRRHAKKQSKSNYYLVVRNFFAGQKFLIYIIIVMHFDKLLLDAIRYSLYIRVFDIHTIHQFILD